MEDTCSMAERKGQWGRALILPLVPPFFVLAQQKVRHCSHPLVHQKVRDYSPHITIHIPVQHCRVVFTHALATIKCWLLRLPLGKSPPCLGLLQCQAGR
jgi:hypothetical protein